VVQAVSCQSIIAEARVHTKTFLCGICGRQRGIGRTWVFPVSTIPQALHTHSPMILLTQSEKLTAQLNNKDRMDKLLLKSQREGNMNIKKHFLTQINSCIVRSTCKKGSKSNL